MDERRRRRPSDPPRPRQIRRSRARSDPARAALHRAGHEESVRLASQALRVDRSLSLVAPDGTPGATEEERQLAVLQRAEQTEKQALAERRQTDADILARQRLLARIQRDQDELQIAVQRAENQRQLVELNAEIEALRLARLEERLRAYPEAVRADVGIARLDVARALAGNSRAVLQIGNADDISQVLMVRDLWSEAMATANGQRLADNVDVATDETDTVTSESPSATAEIE